MDMQELLVSGKNLRNFLMTASCTRWLDVGSGGNFEPGFSYIDLLPELVIPKEVRPRYKRLDILHCDSSALGRLGKFDLVRLQHTLEHFSYHDGQQIISRCSSLLVANGLFLVTVPDLKIHVNRYVRRAYRQSKGYCSWARDVLPEDAPDSFFFSLYAHSIASESHKWCYDSTGLAYALDRSGEFQVVMELPVDHPLASIPFSHSRPDEDLCFLAQKKQT